MDNSWPPVANAVYHPQNPNPRQPASRAAAWLCNRDPLGGRTRLWGFEPLCRIAVNVLCCHSTRMGECAKGSGMMRIEPRVKVDVLAFAKLYFKRVSKRIFEGLVSFFINCRYRENCVYFFPLNRALLLREHQSKQCPLYFTSVHTSARFSACFITSSIAAGYLSGG